MDTGKVFAGGGLSQLTEVPTSLPVGYALGDLREEGGKHYRLVFNAGNSAIDKGFFASAKALGSCGVNSVTVSTTTRAFHHLGAVLAEQITVPTGAYFWGMTRGVPVGGIASDGAAAVATGAAFHIGTNGGVVVAASSVLSGNKPIGYVTGATEAGTVITGAASGDVFIDI